MIFQMMIIRILPNKLFPMQTNEWVVVFEYFHRMSPEHNHRHRFHLLRQDLVI